MNKQFIIGFVKSAAQTGVSNEQAISMLAKIANTDEAAIMAALQEGEQAPAAPQGGVPPDIEQLIQSLPPEVLQQLLLEIQQELGGQAPQEQAPGQEELQAKVAGVQEELLVKSADYKEGFIDRAKEYGLNQKEAELEYTKVATYLENQHKNTFTNDAQKEHFEGFMEKAAEYGVAPAEALNTYYSLFGK